MLNQHENLSMHKRKIRRRHQQRIKKIIEYLERINIGTDIQSLVNNFKEVKIVEKNGFLTCKNKIYKTTFQIKTE